MRNFLRTIVLIFIIYFYTSHLYSQDKYTKHCIDSFRQSISFIESQDIIKGFEYFLISLSDIDSKCDPIIGKELLERAKTSNSNPFKAMLYVYGRLHFPKDKEIPKLRKYLKPDYIPYPPKSFSNNEGLLKEISMFLFSQKSYYRAAAYSKIWNEYFNNDMAPKLYHWSESFSNFQSTKYKEAMHHLWMALDYTLKDRKTYKKYLKYFSAHLMDIPSIDKTEIAYQLSKFVVSKIEGKAFSIKAEEEIDDSIWELVPPTVGLEPEIGYATGVLFSVLGKMDRVEEHLKNAYSKEEIWLTRAKEDSDYEPYFSYSSKRNIELQSKDRVEEPKLIIQDGIKQYIERLSVSENYIAIASEHSIELRDKKGNLIHRWKAHESTISSLLFIKESFLISSSWDDKVKVWKIDGEEPKLYKTFYMKDNVECIAVSPDSTTFAIGSWDKTVTITDIEGKSTIKFRAHQDTVSSLSFSSDGRELLSSSWDGSTKIWDLNGELLKEFQRYKSRVALSFFDSKDRVVIAYWDGRIEVMDSNGEEIISKETQIKVFKSQMFPVSYRKDSFLIYGNILAIVNIGNEGDVAINSIPIENISTANFYSEESLLVGNGNSLEFRTLDGSLKNEIKSYANKILAIQYNEKSKTFFSMIQENSSKQNFLGIWKNKGALYNEVSFPKSMKDFYIHKNGSIFAIFENDPSITILDSQGKIRKMLVADTKPITKVKFHPTNNLVVTGSNSSLKIWSYKNNNLKLLKSIPIQTEYEGCYGEHCDNYSVGVSDLNVSKDGKLIECVSGNNLFFYNWRGKKIWEASGDGQPITKYEVEPKSKKVLISYGDEFKGQLKLYSMSNKKSKLIVPNHPITNFQISKDWKNFQIQTAHGDNIIISDNGDFLGNKGNFMEDSIDIKSKYKFVYMDDKAIIINSKTNKEIGYFISLKGQEGIVFTKDGSYDRNSNQPDNYITYSYKGKLLNDKNRVLKNYNKKLLNKFIQK